MQKRGFEGFQAPGSNCRCFAVRFSRKRLVEVGVKDLCRLLLNS